MTVAAIVGDLFKRAPELRPRIRKFSGKPMLFLWHVEDMWVWRESNSAGPIRDMDLPTTDDEARWAICDTLAEALPEGSALQRIGNNVWRYQYPRAADGICASDRLTCLVAAITAAKERA